MKAPKIFITIIHSFISFIYIYYLFLINGKAIYFSHILFIPDFPSMLVTTILCYPNKNTLNKYI